MELVVDANVVIAALISPRGHTGDLFFSALLTIFAPETLLEEINEHKEELLQKTGLSKEDFEKELTLLCSNIRFFSWVELLPFLSQAKAISPDPDDAIYFALALKLGCPLWSNDKELSKQTSVKVFSTSELLQWLG